MDIDMFLLALRFDTFRLIRTQTLAAHIIMGLPPWERRLKETLRNIRLALMFVLE